MTRREALDRGFCKHCASYGARGWRCGVTLPIGTTECILPAEVVKRWRGEFGLEGETQRIIKSQFGDELPKKRRLKKRRTMS